MPDKKANEKSEIELLRQWLEAAGGNISLGESALKSVELSKNGDKLTIVLRKVKPKKNKPDA